MSALLGNVLCAGTSAVPAARPGRPPAEIPNSLMRRLPTGHAVFAPAASRTPAIRPVARALESEPAPVGQAAAGGYACQLEAYNPYRYGRAVYGEGWNLCEVGLLMKTQACLYNLHHILFIPQWRRATCAPVNLGTHDRPPAFRDKHTLHLCHPGTGKWRTVMFGSDELRPGLTSYGAVKSLRAVKCATATSSSTMSSPAPPPEPPQVRRYGLGPVLASWAGRGDDGDAYHVQLRRALHTRQLWLLCNGARAGSATALDGPAIASRIAGLLVVGGEAQHGAELVEVERASRTERVALSGAQREWLVVSPDTGDAEPVAVRQFGPDGTPLLEQVLDLPGSGAGDRGPRWWRRPFALARMPAGRTRYGRLDR